MKIPGEIKVGGHRIKISLADANAIDSEGTYDYQFRNIRIRGGDYSESTLAETLLHEILECIKHLYQLDLSHKDLTAISEVLFGIIRVNNLDFSDEND